MKIVNKIINYLFLATLPAAVFLGCLESNSANPPSREMPRFASYRDIPNVTNEEIAAIEALKSQRQHFTFMSPISTETFMLPDGTHAGFTAKLCRMLSTLFDIPFVVEIDTWDNLISGLHTGSVDFTGEITPTAERRQSFFMSLPIAQRTLGVFTHKDSTTIEVEHDINGRKIGFWANTITSRFILDAHPELNFEVVLITDEQCGVELLRTGAIDAFIIDAPIGYSYKKHDFIRIREMFSTVYTPVSMATANAELEPIISVMDKFILAGGIDILDDLYNKGGTRYTRYRLSNLYTNTEKEYLDSLASNNSKVRVALESDNYPISFYDERSKSFKGIAVDILAEINRLTGIEFENITNKNSVWIEILESLETGNSSVVSQLIYTEERKPKFLWNDEPYFTARYALLSKIDLPNLKTHQVGRAKVGVVRNTAYEYVYKRWFPNYDNHVYYAGMNEKLDALEQGTVDLVMASENILYALTHQREMPGFKVNIAFSSPLEESYFGFNKNEETLRDIFSKALTYVDIDNIKDEWISRVYDYSRRQLAAQRSAYFALSAVILALMLISLTIVYIKDKVKNKTIATQKIMVSGYEYANKLSGTLVKITRSPTISAGILKDAANIIAREGCIALNATRVGVWNIAEAKEVLKSISCYVAATGEYIIQEDFDFSTNQKYANFFESERLIVTNDVKISEIWSELVDDYSPNLCAILDIPIHIDGKLAGAVCIEQNRNETYREKRVWTIEEQNFASSLADIMALAISGAERRAARDAAIMANHAKSTFLATMSHEIRTPMNSIMGFAELAADSDSIPQIKDYLEKISDSTQWLLRIINDILDISKIESGKMELEHVPFRLQDVIARCQAVILPSVKEKGIELMFYVEPPVGKNMVGDPVRLYQAIMNLLSNAVKFTSAGTVKLSSLVKNMDGNHVTIYFEIRDSGIGMSLEQIDKVFAPFIQADSSTTRNYGGTGLGLTIVKNIVELMGGKLMVDSMPNTGSIFSFEIKFETIDVSDDVFVKEDFNLLEKPHFDGLILVCDDNKMNRQVVCEHLERIGIKTVVSENGKEGVEIVKDRIQKGEKPFDLILMDIFMPIMDGMEAASTITTFNTGTPIVAMTANVMVSELENYRKHGMPSFLGKPFTAQELWRVLLKYLTPVSSSIINGDEYTHNKNELLNMLQINFAKNYQAVYDDIVKAIADDDITLAHRLAHTLKGNAGQIGERELQKVAGEVEKKLKEKLDIEEPLMATLKTEFVAVIEKLKPMLIQNIPNPEPKISDFQTSVLFDELEVMIENINPQVINLLDDIRGIPEAEELVHHIESYDFESAKIALTKLRKGELA